MLKVWCNLFLSTGTEKGIDSLFVRQKVIILYNRDLKITSTINNLTPIKGDKDPMTLKKISTYHDLKQFTKKTQLILSG